MPALGLGVLRTAPQETARAVETAIGAGYRLIDTAAGYLNERDVGAGIRASGIDRAEMFITTKLWIGHYGYDATLRSFDASLKRLGLDYLDLYLLHWPLPGEFDDTAESYRAVEKLLAEGRVRAIGVANFMPHHLENLRARTEVVPAVNQIEMNPFFIQWEAWKANTEHGIVTQSWAPLGGTYMRRPGAVPTPAKSPLEHLVVVSIADKHGKTPAQVVIRWHIQRGLSAVAKSTHPERIKQNFEVFDFTLTEDELARIDGLDTGRRAGNDPDAVTSTSFKVDVDSQ
ncbi:aldo/keto reductase [Trinickia symbiotica]|nr:aldo/keto reductase [Trinickia symbiotica]